MEQFEHLSAASVVVLQTTVTDYRLPVFSLLAETYGDGFRVVAGEAHFSRDITNKAFGQRWHIACRNYFLFNRRLLIQVGRMRELLSCGVLILEGNPRILSSWFVLLLRKLLRGRTIIWSHAFSRSGESSPTNLLRFAMFRLADRIIVYTRGQAVSLERRLGRKWRGRVDAAPNAIMRRSECRFESTEDPRDIIYVGRLVEEKKPRLLLDAFSQALANLPEDTQLHIVGDGRERSSLEREVARLKLGERVKLYGHISNMETLASLYRRSVVAVSPGYVGLSAIQAMSFGVPILISDNEPHAPEVEACQEGFTASFFTADSSKSLADGLVRFLNERRRWRDARQSISSWIEANYTVEAMVESFLKNVEPLTKVQMRFVF